MVVSHAGCKVFVDTLGCAQWCAFLGAVSAVGFRVSDLREILAAKMASVVYRI